MGGNNNQMTKRASSLQAPAFEMWDFSAGLRVFAQAYSLASEHGRRHLLTLLQGNRSVSLTKELGESDTYLRSIQNKTKGTIISITQDTTNYNTYYINVTNTILPTLMYSINKKTSVTPQYGNANIVSKLEHSTKYSISDVSITPNTIYNISLYDSSYTFYAYAFFNMKNQPNINII
jgi:hypothetical protein